MRLLWAATSRHLLRHPAQLALALAGLILGVASIVAVDIATGSAARAFELSLAAVSGPATHEISAGSAGVDETLYAQLARQLHVIRLTPIVEGYVTVGDEALQLVGVDPLAAADFPARETAALAPTAPGVARGVSLDGDSLRAWFLEDGALLAPATLAHLGLAPGAVLRGDAGGRAFQGRVMGSLPPDLAGTGALLLTDIATAQEWLGQPGRLSRIDVRVPGGAVARAELAALQRQLPPGVTLAPAARRAQAGLDMTRAFSTNLKALSLLALLVGLFLVYGAMSFAIVQRRRDLGVLRALGMRRGEILRLVVFEVVVLALAGGAAGLALGTLIAHALLHLVTRTINDLYFVLAVNGVSLEGWQVFKALGGALAVALVAALLPALEATGSHPGLALRRSVLEARARRVVRWLPWVSVVLAVACGVLVAGSSRSVPAGFGALFLVLLAVAALAPALLAGLAGLAARAAGRLTPLGRLALGEVAASLSRTGVAVAALAMAVAAMIGISVMVDSFRESLRDWLADTLQADLYIGAPGPGFSRPERWINPQVAADLARVPGVARAVASRRAQVGSPSGPVAVDAIDFTPDMARATRLVAGDPARAWPAYAAGGLLLAEPLAFRLNLHAGSQLVLTTADGPHAFQVAGVYREYGNDRGSARLDRAVYRRWWHDDAVSSLALYLRPGVDSSVVVRALRAAVAGRQALIINSSGEVRAASMAIFERTFVITRVLDWLAAAVAAIGLVSGLLAWQLARAHELALLRAAGLTRLGAALMIEAQAGFMGVVALLAALPAGLLTALLLVEVINRRAFGWRIDLHLHPAQFVNAVLLAVGAALLAGLYPAWRSRRTALVADLREE